MHAATQLAAIPSLLSTRLNPTTTSEGSQEIPLVPTVPAVLLQAVWRTRAEDRRELPIRPCFMSFLWPFDSRAEANILGQSSEVRVIVTMQKEKRMTSTTTNPWR